MEKMLIPLRKSIAILNKMLPAVCDLTDSDSDTIDLTVSDDSEMNLLRDRNSMLNEVSELQCKYVKCDFITYDSKFHEYRNMKKASHRKRHHLLKLLRPHRRKR